MNIKKITAIILTLAMLLALAACGSTGASTSSAATTAAQTTSAAATTTDTQPANGSDFTFRVAFENSMSEPVGQGLSKWKELVNSQNKGVSIELFPDSQLGAKTDIMDQMLLGDNVVTLTDGSFYAEYGVPEFSVFYAPFLFDNWDKVWKLIDSQWYKDMCAKLDEQGLHIIASNWIYGARQLMTKEKVVSPDDLKGMKIRVPTNAIQTKSFDVMGGTSVAMSLGDVYQALTSGTIDGVENPFATLYGRSFQEVCKYLLVTNHVMNSTTWVCSTQVWNSLTPEQQQLLTETCEQAGEFNNEAYNASTEDYIQKMEAAGVTVTNLTDAERQAWKDKAMGIWDYAADFKWSDDLYNNIQAIING